MRYYESTLTGKIITENDLHVLYDIYGDNVIKDPLCHGILVRVDEPTVIACSKYGRSTVMAVIRSREIHDCTLKEAYDIVKKIKKDVEKYSCKPED